MTSELKSEPGSRPSGELDDDGKLVNMSIPDLIFELRIATRTKQFDQVEQVLVAREAQLKDDANKMREILELERLERMEIEAKLKECQKQCEEMKRGEYLYEKLLANVKKNGLQDTTVEELRAKNSKLEVELNIWKEKFLELNERISKVEYETQLLVKERNNEGDHGADLRVTLKVKGEKEADGIYVHGFHPRNNNAESNAPQRNGVGNEQSSSNPNKDVSASGRLGQRPYNIEISDGDNDNDDDNDEKEGTSQFVTDNRHPNSSAAAAQQQKSNPGKEDLIGMLKRKYRLQDHKTSDKRSKA